MTWAEWPPAGTPRHSPSLVSTLHRTFNKWDQLRMGTKLRMAEQATNEGLQTFCRWCQRRIMVVTGSRMSGAEQWKVPAYQQHYLKQLQVI